MPARTHTFITALLLLSHFYFFFFILTTLRRRRRRPPSPPLKLTFSFLIPVFTFPPLL